MQSKIIKKLKSFLSYSLKLFILTSFLLSQSFIAEIFLYQNNPNTKSINIAQADYNDPWYNTSYSYRKPITIHANQVSHTTEASQSNFPVLISLTDPDLKTTTNSGKVQNDPNGYDIIFTSQDGSTQLDHEMEKYDPATGEIVAWVKIPILSSVSDTTLYIYYGNNAINATQEHKANVWNDGIVGGGNFKGVWHMNQDPGGMDPQLKDSTVNHNDVTTSGMTTSNLVTGRVGNAISFDGNLNYAYRNMVVPGNNGTVSMWIYSPAVGVGGSVFKSNANTRTYFAISSTSLVFTKGNPGVQIGNSIPKASTSGWHHYSLSWKNVSGSLFASSYFDGIGVTNGNDVSFLGNADGASMILGAFSTTGTENSVATDDELHLSDIARSADWIKTEYNNQANSGTFLSLGLEENTLPPILMEVNPISTPTTNTTPSYTFSSTKSGTIAYAGDCSSSITSAVSGNNTITFNALSFSTHSNCRIQITDIFGVQSNLLSVTSFTINTAITTYVVPAITDDLRILPESSISSSYLSDTVSAQISSGEYKAVSFVVKSNYNINALQVEASNLTGNGNTIPNSAVDIKSVKCWYRGDYGTTYVVKGRYLTPELLLKDDSLVNVDGDTWNQWNVSNPDGKNYLKLTDGSYIDISSATPQWSHADVVPISERPVQDAATLQPINLPANYNKQLWITLHMPDNTPAGNYSGTISLKDGAQTMKSLNVNIQVLPINLPQPNIEYSIYYYGQIIGNGSISSNDKTAQQYTAEQKDMREHGITNPNTFFTDSNLLQQVSIRQQAGMDNTDFYNRSTSDTSKIPYYKNLLASYGVVNFWMYGPDEQDLNTPVNRAHINDVHNAGGKYFNSQTVSHADSVADILDLAVVSGDLSPTLAAKYHSYGHKVYSYANPQIVPNYPRLFRMNFGLALWQADYDGAMDYVYQGPFGDIWNDFDYVEGGNAYRDCVFALPTMDGVVDTIKWEGFREGVNDMRYLAVLQDAIATAKNQGGDTTATEAENYLANLKSSNLTNQDLDAIRSRIIDYILDLQSSSHSLVINRGTGSGSYTKDNHVNIMADTPQAGMVFNKWIGDTQYVSNVNASSTTVIMPSHSLSLTATYISSWYSNEYSYRKTIIIDHTKVSNTNQSNFPVLISLTDASLKNIANGGKVQNPNGYDIIFALPNGTLLNYEIESYDNTTGKLVAWVKIPLLLTSIDTFLYVYYGNPNATINTTSTAVWDSDFKGVWHLGDTPVGHAVGDYKDSTINANNSTNITNEPSIASGQISGAQGFNGTSSYIDEGNNSSLNIANNITVSAWVNLNSTTGHNGIINKNGYQLYFLVSRSSHLIRFWLGGTSWTDYIVSYEAYDMPIGGWHYVTAKYDNSTGIGKIYLDGNEVASNSKVAGNPVSTSHLEIGRLNPSNHFFNGSLDEVRISDTARSADWIKTEYNNESNPNTFLTLSSEENLLPPTITSLSSNLPNGTYGTGTTIPITINFSKDVTSSGNITLTLNTTPQRTCSFTITNNNSATCNYTIQGGDSATNLNATISGTIHDQFNNPLTNFTPISNLSDNTTININTSSSPFTPPTKPNITNINITVLDNGTTAFNLPSNITQIAISHTPDFANVSWQDFDQDKFSHINETQETIYVKFRTNEGAVSDTIIITPQTSINNTISLIDGDIIQCKSSNDPNAVYIVKITGTKTYIRHIISIQIFNYYKHLKWENLKQVDSLTPFSLSSWIRVNTNTNGLPKAGDKVYEINGDQSKHWINMTSSQFLSHGGSDEAIYTVNAGELNLYSAGPDVVSL